MQLAQYRDWFNIVCDDLDVDREFTRPEFIISQVRPCSFNELENSVYINPQEIAQLNLCTFDTIAHEIRHWWQSCKKMSYCHSHHTNYFIPGIVVTGVWMNNPFQMVVTNQQEHEQIPWEVDAIEYARDVCARLLKQSAA